MSAATPLPLWGQAWELTVIYETKGGEPQQVTLTQDTWEPEALRMTFEVLQAMNSSPFWYADIAIYNMTDQAAQNTLLHATWVTLKAGFQTGPNQSQIIWDGPVFQTLFTREDVVDTKVTLHCFANPFVMEDIVNFSVGPFADQELLAARMAGEVGLPDMSVGGGTLGGVAAKRLAANVYPRGRGIFGKVGKYIAQLADSNFMQTWRDGEKAYISEIDSGVRTPELAYSPPFPPNYTDQQLQIPVGATRSLIGTPVQTQQGVDFTVLLDPRLSVRLPPLLVQLARTQIAQIERSPSPYGGLPTALNSNLTFFVAQVRHVGDTRGNQWYTQVTGYSTTYASNVLDGIFSPDSIGR